MLLSMIVAYAYDKDGKFVIGNEGALPWRIRKDMLWFKECTTGSAVVMGRKTYESIGRLLPKRDNIIVSKNPEYKVEGAYVFPDIDSALSFAARKDQEIFVIGGQSLYEQCIDRVDRLYVTTIKGKKYEGDCFFPKWEQTSFKAIQKESSVDDVNGVVEYTIFQRIKFSKDQVDPIENSPYNLNSGLF